MTEAERLDLLKTEYFKLQDIVESFDSRALQIKGWSVTVSLAGLVTAFASKEIGSNGVIICAIAALSALCFWIIEFFWKCFQWTLIHRLDEIEEFMRGGAPDLKALQIRAVWRKRFKPEVTDSLLKAKFLKPSLALPHALVMCMAVLVAGRFPVLSAG